MTKKLSFTPSGKFSPFDGANVVNHGFETDKRKADERWNEMDALVFSSRVDNYPLILCEALSIGVPVIATHSDAAREVLEKSGGKTFAEQEVLPLVQLPKAQIAQGRFCTDPNRSGNRSRKVLRGTTDAGGVCLVLSESVVICCCR